MEGRGVRPRALLSRQRNGRHLLHARRHLAGHRRADDPALRGAAPRRQDHGRARGGAGRRRDSPGRHVRDVPLLRRRDRAGRVRSRRLPGQRGGEQPEDALRPRHGRHPGRRRDARAPAARLHREHAHGLLRDRPEEPVRRRVRHLRERVGQRPHLGAPDDGRADQPDGSDGRVHHPGGTPHPRRVQPRRGPPEALVPTLLPQRVRHGHAGASGVRRRGRVGIREARLPHVPELRLGEQRERRHVHPRVLLARLRGRDGQDVQPQPLLPPLHQRRLLGTLPDRGARGRQLRRELQRRRGRELRRGAHLAARLQHRHRGGRDGRVDRTLAHHHAGRVRPGTRGELQQGAWPQPRRHAQSGVSDPSQRDEPHRAHPHGPFLGGLRRAGQLERHGEQHHRLPQPQRRRGQGGRLPLEPPRRGAFARFRRRRQPGEVDHLGHAGAPEPQPRPARARQLQPESAPLRADDQRGVPSRLRRPRVQAHGQGGRRAHRARGGGALSRPHGRDRRRDRLRVGALGLPVRDEAQPPELAQQLQRPHQLHQQPPEVPYTRIPETRVVSVH